MPRLPRQPPALEGDVLVFSGAVEEETGVAETFVSSACAVEVGEGVVAWRAGGEEDGVLDGETSVASTREVEVSSGIDTGIEASLMEGLSTTEGAVEARASAMPVKTFETEDSLETGSTMLEEIATSAALPCPGATVTVTMGFSVTVATPASQVVEPRASTPESSAPPALLLTSTDVVRTPSAPPIPPKPRDSGMMAEEMALTAVARPVLRSPVVVLPIP